MLAALLLLLPSFQVADIVLPGSKKVPHELVFASEADLAGLRLVASTRMGPKSPGEVVPGQPFTYSAKYGTRLYVVTADEALPERFDEAWCAAHPSASPPVSDQSTQPVTSPVTRVLTRLRVASFGPEGLVLAEAGTQREWNPMIAILGAGLVLLGAAVLLLLRRRRNAARAQA